MLSSQNEMSYIFRLMKLLLLSLVTLLVMGAEAAKLELVGPSKKEVFSVDTLRSRLKMQTVKIEDPVYKAVKEFDGFLLEDVLNQVSNGKDLDEIVFTAIDGYSPNMNANLLKKHRAYLVFQEHNKPFEKVVQGKQRIDPGPYYVVWEEGPKVEHSVPWPYQVVKIEAVDFKKKYPKIFPNGPNEAELKGFSTFKSQCLRCHSINLEGGDVGPELNIPRNVTEYWDVKHLREFIPHPSRFRAKSKMPDIAGLTGADVENVIAYLKKMKTQKMQ